MEALDVDSFKGDEIDLLLAPARISGSFFNCMRMSSEDYEVIINTIGETFFKLKTKLRNPIPLTMRLAGTLRFLATGDSYSSLMHSHS